MGGGAGPRDPADKVVSRTEAVRRAGPGRSFRLVFTNGVFDLMHPGHVHCLRRARELGDVLLVAVNSDASVQGGSDKGPGRPLVGEREPGRGGGGAGVRRSGDGLRRGHAARN